MRTSLLLALLTACGGPVSTSDGGPGRDASSPADASALDAGSSSDAAATPDGGCGPLGGAEVREGYVQQSILSILRFDDASPEAEARGYVTVGGNESCGIVDRVEIRTASGDLLYTLSETSGTLGAFAARGTAPPVELTSLCDGETGRFDPFAIEVHGRVPGASFVARGGAELNGSGWPPDLVVTCHRNLPVGPLYLGNGMVQVNTMFTTTDLWTLYPNERGLAIDSVEGAVRILPGTWGFGSVPIDPFDTAGWTASVSFPTSERRHVSVQLGQLADPLGPDVCPTPSAMPMPGDPVPPVFLAVLRGQAGGRAFTSEAMISYCSRVTF